MRSGIFIAVLVTFVSCAHTEQHTITILHTNDIHAKFIPHPAFWVKSDPKPMVGGINELTHIVDSIRAAVPVTLLLDGGDVMTGNPISDMKYAGAEGGALFEMMNRIGYDASCIGNHDFDISQDNLHKIVGIEKFPTFSANVVDKNGKCPFEKKDYAIIERGGLKIGVFGLMLQNLAGMVFQDNIIGLKVLSPIETARKIVAELESKTDLIIAVTHQGVEDDSALAMNVPGLNVIVGGHSHTRLRKPKFVNNVVIVQAGSDCENLGVLDLTVENKRVIKYEGQLIQLWANEGRKTRLSPLVDSIATVIDKEYSEVIADLKTDWKRGDGETNVGNFITEAMAEATGSEIGITNTHGIRKDVVAGPLTKRDLYEVLPFRNMIATFQLSGKGLRAIMMYYLTKKPDVQISAVTCQWRKTNGTVEIVQLEVHGKPVDDSRMYTCATSDFFVGQAKGYIGQEINQPIFLNKTMFEVAEKAVRKAKVITSKIENRFQEIK